MYMLQRTKLQQHEENIVRWGRRINDVIKRAWRGNEREREREREHGEGHVKPFSVCFLGAEFCVFVPLLPW